MPPAPVVPPPPTLPSLAERLRSAYPELTETERKAADVLMASPAAVATYSGKEIAARSGISRATFSRLIRRLGYAGFDEARRMERARRASGSPYLLFDTAEPAGAGRIARQMEEEQRMLRESLALLDPEAIGELGAVLAQAPQLWFAGFRNSRFLADYARALFTTLRPGAYALAPSGQTLAEGIAGVSSGDVVVAFGMRRRVAFFLPLLEALAAQEAQILLITDRSLRTPVQGVRWTLLSAVETAQPIDSYVGALALTRLLVLETLHHLGPEARARLGRIEAAQARLRELE